MRPQPRSRRFAVPFPVRISVQGTGDDPAGKIRDFSQTGMFVRTRAAPRVQQAVLLEFLCGQTRCVVTGTVVSVRTGGFAVEIVGANGEFDTLCSELESVREPVSRDVLAAIRHAELMVG